MMKALYGDSASRQTSSRQTSSLLDGGDSCITAVDFIQPLNPLASAPETQQFVHGA